MFQIINRIKLLFQKKTKPVNSRVISTIPREKIPVNGSNSPIITETPSLVKPESKERVISNYKLLERIKELDTLPTLPQNTIRLVEMSNDPDSSLKDVQKILMSDPVLATRVMKVANSALYGRSVEAKTLQDAVFTLGMSQVVSLGISTGMMNSFDNWKEIYIPREMLWKHVACTAFLSKSFELRKKIPKMENVDIYLAALLHDIGWIALDYLEAEKVEIATKYVKQTLKWTLDDEWEIFGLDHGIAGGQLLEMWGLPGAIADIVRYHHTPDKCNSHIQQAALVQLSSSLSPYPNMMEPFFETIHPSIPHRLESTVGSEAVLEMNIRYEKNISQAKTMADMIMR